MSIQYVKDKLLVGTMYAPFCRTKYVDTSEWEQDIRRMAEMGYTCLHGFSEWWRVEKQKGVFDFSEQDYLIELCVKYGIVPIINVATQNGVGYYMPRWMQMDHASLIPANNYGIVTDTVYDILLPTGAAVVEGTSEAPLITRNSFGKGEAWYFAWQAFVCYKRGGGVPALREKVRNILAENGVVPFVRVENKDHLPDPGISASKLQLANGKRAITFVNPSYEPTELKVVIPNASKVTVMIGADTFTQRAKGDDLEICLSFGAWDSTMFLVED